MRVEIPGIHGNLGECVLCGKTFFEVILLNTMCHMIHVDGFSRDLPIHAECLTVLEANGKDWRTLPDGPLRKEFARAYDERVAMALEEPLASPEAEPAKPEGRTWRGE